MDCTTPLSLFDYLYLLLHTAKEAWKKKRRKKGEIARNKTIEVSMIKSRTNFARAAATDRATLPKRSRGFFVRALPEAGYTRGPL